MYAFKLETSSERKGGSLLLKEVDCFPSGSMVDGLPAALLGRCQLKNIKETLRVSWPAYGGSAVSLIKSLPHKNVLPGLDFGSNNGEDSHLRFSQIKNNPFESELYT